MRQRIADIEISVGHETRPAVYVWCTDGKLRSYYNITLASLLRCQRAQVAMWKRQEVTK